MKTFKIKVELPEALASWHYQLITKETLEEALTMGLWETLREFKECNSAAFKGKEGREELARVEAVEGAMIRAVHTLVVTESS